MKKAPNQFTCASIDPALLLGESVVRRLLAKKRLLRDEFGKDPTPAVNTDFMGHSRGIVQSENNQHESDLRPEVDLFIQLKRGQVNLPKFKGDLNNSAAGFFVSMNRLKPGLFYLEHKYFTAEKLFSTAAASGLMVYPVEKMNEAMKEILLSQSYERAGEDLTGTTENNAITRIFRATSSIDDMVAAFILRTGNTIKNSSPTEYQIVIINPHPFNVDTIAEVEIQVNDSDFTGSGLPALILHDELGEKVSSQCEMTETSNEGDNIKKIAFRATVPGGRTKRYSCYFENNSEVIHIPEPLTDLVFKTERSKLVFDSKTGFPSAFEFAGNQLLGIENMNFTLIDENSNQFSATINGSFQISAYGPVRTILKSSFICSDSQIHVKYLIPGGMQYFDVVITVARLGKGKILRWEIPMGYNMNCVGRSLSGITCCKHRNREFVFRDWLGMKNFEGNVSLSLCANGAFSFDIDRNTVRISLFRGTDNPSNTFRCRFFPGNTDDVIDRSFNNSDLFNNPLITSQISAKGSRGHTLSGISISDPSINLQAVKLNEKGDLVLRLLNPCKATKRFSIEIPPFDLVAEIEIASRKLKTLIVEKTSGRLIETDLLERIKI